MLLLVHRANRDRQSCWFISVSYGTYSFLPFCSGFAFALRRTGPRAVLVPRHSLMNTWGSNMSREMAGNKHRPFCPPAPSCPSWVSAPKWVFSCPDEDIEALNSASNLIFWSRRPGPQCGDSRSILYPEALPTGGHFVHSSHRCHSKGVQNGTWSRAHKMAAHLQIQHLGQAGSLHCLSIFIWCFSKLLERTTSQAGLCVSKKDVQNMVGIKHKTAILGFEFFLTDSCKPWCASARCAVVATLLATYSILLSMLRAQPSHAGKSAKLLPGEDDKDPWHWVPRARCWLLVLPGSVLSTEPVSHSGRRGWMFSPGWQRLGGVYGCPNGQLFARKPHTC